MKIVTTTIHKGGSVTVTTEGFDGAECQQATEEFERRLGVKTSDTPTDEARGAINTQAVKATS